MTIEVIDSLGLTGKGLGGWVVGSGYNSNNLLEVCGGGGGGEDENRVVVVVGLLEK